MRQTFVKTSLCMAVVGAGLLLNTNTTFAQNGLSSMLPTAGFSTAISEGTSVKAVKEEVKTLVKEEKLDVVTLQEDTITLDKEIVETKLPPPPEPEVLLAPNESADTMGDELKEKYKNLVIAQVDSYVNVRDLPDEQVGEIVGKLYDKSVGDFIEEVDGWYKISSGNCTGYVKASYCVTGDEAVDVAKEVGKLIATVNTTTLYVRDDASVDARCIGMVGFEDDLVVTEELDGWVKVDIEEGFGYVSKEYVSLKTEFVTAESKEEEEARLMKEKLERERANAAAKAAANKSETLVEQPVAGQTTDADSADLNQPQEEPVAATVAGSGAGVDVVNFALQFVGNPYVHGGTSLTNGADCSGFVMSVYANFGVALPHSSAADRTVGYDVGGIENAIPGDIVCYSGHVAIYIGDGQIVHASTSKTGIIVGNANYRTPLCVRRIF